jgi:hypothetical protein
MRSGPVLDDQDPDGASAAQDRHPHHGAVGILAGLGTVGEGGVGGRVGQGQRLARADDHAGQALARAQPQGVHGLGVQPFSCEQLQVAAGPLEVDGADVGHHRDGDDVHHLVQARLRLAPAGHRLADLAQQASRSSHGQAGGHKSAPPSILQPSKAGVVKRETRDIDPPCRSGADSL